MQEPQGPMMVTFDDLFRTVGRLFMENVKLVEALTARDNLIAQLRETAYGVAGNPVNSPPGAA